MAYEVVVTAQAEEDLEGIVAYLTTTLAAPTAASSFLEDFDAFAMTAAKLQESYPVSQDERLGSLGYRKAIIKKYVILFRIEDGLVYVAHIFHARQDYARLV